MRNVVLKWEKRTRGDHKRSFDSHRTRFQRGDLEKGWKPKYHFYRFGNFEEYTADLGSKVSKLVDERLSFFKQQVPNVEVLVYGSGEAIASNAIYFGYSSLDQKLKMGYNRDLIADSFYGYLDEEQSKHALNTLQRVTDHELKHFIDRSFVKHKDQVLKAGIPKVAERNWSTANSAGIMLTYLAKLRTEGFAEFDGNLKILNCRDENMLRASAAAQTKVANEGINFLAKSPLVDRLDWYQFEKQRGFSCYRQGKAMFELIGLAENFNPQEPNEVSQLLKKVVFLRDFKSFFSYYYNCVRSLGLNENQSILRPEHAKRIIQVEEQDFMTYLLLSSLHKS